MARQLKKKREPAAPASTTVLPMQLQVGGTPARSCKEETLMPTFVATDPVGYEKFVGRWSQRLAPLFAEYAGVTAGERVLDVGCGTGNLTAALAGARVAAATGIDLSPSYIEYARRSTS